MERVTSPDGTSIAFDRIGNGPALVILSGGPVDRSAHEDLATLLSEHFTVLNYDRRGRGDSGDIAPYSADREYEDLAAVIDAAGGTTYAFGSSGGAMMGFEGIARGLNITGMVAWEPPYIVPGSRPAVPSDYGDKLRDLLAEGRRGEMVELFLTEAAGIPAEFVAQIRQFPGWDRQEAIAHVLVYDSVIAGDFSIPEDKLAAISVPTLVLDGGTTPWLSQTAEAVSKALPHATRQTLTGQAHNVDPAAIAPAITAYLAHINPSNRP